MRQYERYNLVRMWIFNVLRTISASCLSILPVYFLRGGLSEVQISFYNSLASTVNLVISLCCSGITAQYKDSRPVLAAILLIQGCLTAVYALFSVITLNAEIFYICVLAVASLIAVVSALVTIFEYKLPCEVMEMDSYSTYAAYLSLFGGVVGTGISLALPILFQHFSFFSVASFCIIVAAVTLMLSAFVTLRLNPLEQPMVLQRKQRLRINPIMDMQRLLNDREFRILFIPNILRGFGAGVLSIVSLIAIRALSMKDGDVTLITAAANIGTFLSSFLYVYLVKRIGIPRTGLVGGLIFCLICFSTLGNVLSFLIVYGVASIGLHILGNAVPNMIYCSADASIMSQFHTWRLALYALGAAIGTPIYAALLDVVSIPVLFVISSGATLLSVLAYYLLYRKKLTK